MPSPLARCKSSTMAQNQEAQDVYDILDALRVAGAWMLISRHTELLVEKIIVGRPEQPVPR